MKKLFMIVAGLFALGTTPALADNQWFVRAGVSELTLSKSLDLTVGGQTVPGAELSTKNGYTPSIAIGRYVAPHWAIVATLGIPPHLKMNGGGTIAPYGKLGETTYGPSALTVQYHFLDHGVVRPYVGAGGSYMLVFSTKDGSLQNVKLRNDFAPIVEAGSDFMITPKQGLFIDVKKSWLKTTATGSLMGYPVVGHADLYPWVFSAGATFKF